MTGFVSHRRASIFQRAIVLFPFLYNFQNRIGDCLEDLRLHMSIMKMIREEGSCLVTRHDPHFAKRLTELKPVTKIAHQQSALPIVHPIHTLPVELTSLIFVHCLPQKQFPNLLVAPLLLIRVCSAWRAIALRTPELWSCPFFDLFHVPEARVTRKLRLLEYWVAHGAATAYPFTLLLHSTADVLVPALASQSARWREIDVVLPAESLAALPPSLDLPLLEHLALGCLQSVSPTARITSFSGAPRLSAVSLLGLLPSHVALPWTQLTTFHGQLADLADGLCVLHRAPALRELRLTLRRVPPPPPTPAPPPIPLVHHTLCALVIHAPAASTALLAGLALPALRTLELDLDTPDRELPAFLARAPGLRRLVFVGALPIDVLRPLRALAHLELRDAGMHIHALLAALADDGAFLPRLTSVYVDGCRAPVPYRALLCVLRARWGGVLDDNSRDVEGELGGTDAGEVDAVPVRLQSFVMTVMGRETTAEEVECLSALRALKAQGMQVSVSHFGGTSVI
ncbi:hypothetical protein B0H10DRAFT_2228873 [Mycena sp. CBHHK59/15]|nr:hypothetical protein B0H10DRAFT_2228873 [Mycena sp. CBHHK59/15]